RTPAGPPETRRVSSDGPSRLSSLAGFPEDSFALTDPLLSLCVAKPPRRRRAVKQWNPLPQIAKFPRRCVEPQIVSCLYCVPCPRTLLHSTAFHYQPLLATS